MNWRVLESWTTMNKNRILVLTDSLGLPRETPELVEYEETYFYQLRKEFTGAEFIQSSIGGATINVLSTQAEYLRLLKPNIVILQSGIVDSSPRALTQFELDLVKRIPLISKYIAHLIRKNKSFLRKRRGITYTSHPIFEERLKHLRNVFSEATIVCLGIVPANKQYEENLPGVGKNIEMFNDSLRKEFGDLFIDNSDLVETGLMSDNHHLNKKGHKVVYQKLRQSLSNYLASKAV